MANHQSYAADPILYPSVPGSARGGSDHYFKPEPACDACAFYDTERPLFTNCDLCSLETIADKEALDMLDNMLPDTPTTPDTDLGGRPVVPIIQRF